MTVEKLVSTMHKNNTVLIDEMNIKSNAIILNQTSYDSKLDLKDNITWINSTTRGLSISRNICIKESSSEICLIADDDLIYVNDVEEVILNEFIKYPNYDILLFKVNGIDKEFKKYGEKSKDINYLTSMRHASVEIAFKRDSIIDKNIRFQEEFGSGSIYRMGEDNIFLFDCLKRGLRIKYVPIHIADLYVGDSTWFRGYNKKYFYDLGAVYSRMTRMLSPFLIMQFSIRKFDLYSKEVSFFKSLKYMFAGRKEYLKTKNKNL